jgi:quercetin dioxygenase-like cupin family protein
MHWKEHDVRIYSFGAADGRPISQYGSERLTITGIVRVAGGDVQVGCMHLEPGGRVGAHQATPRQLFLVVRGTGWVRGPELEQTPIVADQAAFWEDGEEHESGSETGMVALVIESDTLDPDQFLHLIR